MKNIWNFLFLCALIVNYSYGRYLADWSTATDQSLIDECLNTALRQIHNDQDNDISQLKAANIVCKTKLINGLHINLYFDLEQHRWECTFYKSPVETLGIQFEACNQVENQNLPEQIQEKLSSSDNEQEEEEEDDEAKIDEISQGTRDENNQQDPEQNTDNNVEEIDDEEMLNTGENNQQDSDQNTTNGDEANPEVVAKENVNTEGENENNQ